MRILQVNSTKNFGGGERHFVDICQGLRQKGHEVFAIVHPENSWSERLSFLGENLIKLKINNSLDFLSAFKIAKICREKEIELIHAHPAKDYLPASLACRLLPKTKLFLTRHVLFPLSPFYKKALDNVTKVIAVSNSVLTELEKVFPTEKIALIPNGIRIENWTNLNKNARKSFLSFHKIPEDSFIVGTLGELKELKGQIEFILAAKQVIADFPHSFFVIVGQDHSITKHYKTKLKRLIKILGLQNRILFLDWVEDTSEFFSSIDVFVSASRNESFGLAILEAMASGSAIVATKTQGAIELLDNASAKLVSVKDAVQIAEAIKFFLESESRRRQFGKNAQKKALNFSLEKTIESLEKIYQA
ncbi:MAG: glycosyltransferase family 4 protein [Pyrinomonadaceae bacterium]|nr:glycosyltransferase family 4 protein [Pyrinomonadaceae bacterium]MCX7639742.1 glycosyltransferase family 4 protein [Pyrinomonadaceae bacterium]MDW8304325.1 glycosyltransferase family 4 protein [Acidobacteriota bacterium]